MKSAVFTTNTWESPLAFLRFGGPYELAGIQLLPGGDPDSVPPELISDADVIVIQRDFPRRRNVYAQVTALANEYQKPVIFEMDDLLFELPDDHPDVQSGYYVETIVPMVAALARADAITVSTPRLAAYLGAINPHVHLLPNYLNDSFWNMKPVQPKIDDRPVVIGYMGGPSHLPDLQAITPALKNILRRYGSKVRLHMIGTNPPEDLLSEPALTWEGAPTYVYRDFASILPAKTIDIAIAPLRDNLFNRCKSAIKFLEYAAAGAAGVFSDIGTYDAVIVPGENGFLASDADSWEESISRLIESDELRASVANQAQQTARDGWLLSQHSHEWFDAYQHIIQAGVESAAGQNPLERMLDRVLEWQDQRASKEGLESARVYELLQAIDRVKAEAGRNLSEVKLEVQQRNEVIQKLEGEKQQIEFEAGKVRLERDTADAWVNSILHSTTWRLIQAGGRLIPGAIKPDTMKVPPDLLKKKVTTAKQQDQPAKEKKKTARLAVVKAGEGGASSLAPTNQYDVVVFAIMDWGTRVQRPQQLAMQFASRGHRVFYTRTSFVIAEYPQVTEVAENIWEIVLPLPRHANVYKDSLEADMLPVLMNAFDTLRETFHMTNAISLVDLPFWYPVARKLRDDLGWKMIYDCMDYHAGFSTTEQASLDREDDLIREADLVLATSHSLMERVSALNQNCLLVPNGADFDHFRFSPPVAPNDIVGLGSPLIGYYGAIADWFDTRLVRYLALARPNWNFVLIGSTMFADLEPLQGLPNVHLLGEKPYRILPAFLHRFDAAIIPFKKTPLTDATNPVKLFEYMSAGKGVVATDLDELRHYAQIVTLATTNEEWLASLEKVLKESSKAAVNERYEFARQNTWQQRIADIRTAIAALYPKVSIVVLTYNNKDFTRLCLDSIFEKTAYPNYEVVLVDNASVDGTQEMLEDYRRRYANVQVILNAQNEGFARGNNIGARSANGEYLVFLNNDTVVTRGWLDSLLRHLQDPQIGMVGPVTSWSGNETRIPVDYVTFQEMDSFAEAYTAAHFGETFDIKVLAFLCVALRKQVWDEIGPLDEIFGTGMFEDDDYAVRVKEKGYRIICAEDVFIHHAGRASFSKLDQDRYQQLFNENLRKFEQKWGRPWEPHQYRTT